MKSFEQFQSERYPGIPVDERDLPWEWCDWLQSEGVAIAEPSAELSDGTVLTTVEIAGRMFTLSFKESGSST